MSVSEAETLWTDRVYHEETKSWICPQGDPYRLENFQQAYDDLVSGQSRLTNASGEFATKIRSVQDEFRTAAKKQSKLEATHFAVKILPKTEEEQRALEWDEQLKVAYVPFDYVSVPEEQVQNIKMSRSGTSFHEEAAERRYTVTYEGGMSSEGPTAPITYELPVLYVVWPCDKPFPADMDYEVLYDVFLPQATTA